jgi:dTDP-4-dehydrorhamnose 3,5-epimerase
MSGLDGVVLTYLEPHSDNRGVFTEVYRAAWSTKVEPIQWNIVFNQANVLRGLHVHSMHTDYLTCIAGELFVGLKDVRPRSPTRGRVETLILREASPCAVTIPPGVAHGFFSATPSRHLYGVSAYWNMSDELGCRWDDPQIGIDWPTKAPQLSPRDQNAGSFAQMADEWAAANERGFEP